MNWESHSRQGDTTGTTSPNTYPTYPSLPSSSASTRTPCHGEKKFERFHPGEKCWFYDVLCEFIRCFHGGLIWFFMGG